MVFHYPVMEDRPALPGEDHPVSNPGFSDGIGSHLYYYTSIRSLRLEWGKWPKGGKFAQHRCQQCSWHQIEQLDRVIQEETSNLYRKMKQKMAEQFFITAHPFFYLLGRGTGILISCHHSRYTTYMVNATLADSLNIFHA